MRNILVGALLVLVGACETIGFYGQAASGQWAILRAKQPSERLIASAETDPALRAQLQQVASLLSFAKKDLALGPEEPILELRANRSEVRRLERIRYAGVFHGSDPLVLPDRGLRHL